MTDCVVPIRSGGGLNWSACCSVIGERLQTVSDPLGQRIEGNRAGCHPGNSLVRLLGRIEVEVVPVEIQELERRKNSDTLVAVDEGVIARDPVEQRCGLAFEAGVELLATEAGLRTRNGRVSQPKVGHPEERVYLEPEDLARDGEDIIELEVVHVSLPPACSGALRGAPCCA